MPLNAFLRNAFDDVWQQYDPQGTGFISLGATEQVIHHLPRPLGVDKSPASPTEVREIIDRLHLPNRGGRIYYYDMLEHLTLDATGVFVLPEGVEHVSAVKDRIEEYRAKTALQLSSLRAESTVGETMRIVKIQRAMRRSLRMNRAKDRTLVGRAQRKLAAMRRKSAGFTAFVDSPTLAMKRKFGYLPPDSPTEAGAVARAVAKAEVGAEAGADQTRQGSPPAGSPNGGRRGSPTSPTSPSKRNSVTLVGLLAGRPIAGDGDDEHDRANELL